MSLSADFPAEQGIAIPDNWETSEVGAAVNGIYWIVNPNRSTDRRPHGKEQSRPRGLFADTRDGAADTTWANIRAILWGENEQDWKTYRIACNVVHPIAVKAIDMKLTNARGIKILF